ncbi:hypothetical protein MKX01_025842 [Papaver californicum]|nr:hypothetical protein MKX01_025842 [Papaver californicum]
MAVANLYLTVNLKFSHSFHKNSTKLRHRPISSLFTEPTRTSIKKSETGRRRRILKTSTLDEFEIERLSVKGYLERSVDLIRSDGGPPRWFSPIECNSSVGGVRFENSPLLLYLPGIDGVGLGLIMHHQRLGKMFDVWCLHILVMDRTPFEEHVQLVERTIKSENSHSPYRPIYLVGESLGGTSSTSFNKSPMQPILPLLEVIPEQLHTGLPYFLGFVTDILPRESLLWKLQMLRSASSFANSRLHAVKAEVLALSRKFDLVTVIKGAGFYRRTKKLDYVSDFMHPNQSELRKMYDSYRWVDVAANPVMLSKLENGEVVKGLGGIPSDGPVVYVGYHMLLGLELGPLVSRFLAEKNILLRGIAHPMMFGKIGERSLPDSSSFDVYRIMGGVPVSANNFYRLLSKKSHVLLYPGGVREALHRKGEAYKLFWPSHSEFVRMAANFGAKIVPFGVVGEDDLFDVVFDYDDYMKFPWSKAWIEDLNNGRVRNLSEAKEEVTEEDLHFPGILPKIPGRFYFLFGKPIETQGESEYLKDKRENDPYRTLLSRLIYQASHGFTSEIPTFEF